MTQPTTYRKRPVVIEAMRYDGTPESATPIINWMARNDWAATWSEPYEAHTFEDGEGYPAFAGGIKIPTLTGTMVASAGDWVIRDIKGEFYPCDAEVFAMTYEPVATTWDHFRAGTTWVHSCGQTTITRNDGGGFGNCPVCGLTGTWSTTLTIGTTA